ncbi:MAG: GDYXXLXY domain-containing protein [Planococcus sp. (in: firmicutes)]|uniref:GDYXXLXY domain-containing protein n=1 Tax=Planococcus halocryophilus TaxID=1215089 RepID=UPI001F0DF263|nr:GDYXXLXY domain-containing protein [Planococcus halocryophilus]MCH4827350.1 GDYXXLXY domain-containing protein [Planococcus halocryophilus]
MKAWLLPIIQTVFIVVLLVSYYAATWFGEQYILRAEPLDPFDPFYGEYVMLQYPDLQSPSITDDSSIYFTLKTGEDGYAILDRVETNPFFGAIEGYVYDSRVTAPQLEQFYVEQGQGPQLEEIRDLQVTIDVSSWGIIRPISLEERIE